MMKLKRSPAERFKAIVDAVDLRMFPFKLSVSAQRVDDGRWFLNISYPATDRKDGLPTKITHTRYVPEYEYLRASDDEIVEYVRRALLDALVHELDECFLVAGERVRDPHWREEMGNSWKPDQHPPFTLPDPMPPRLPDDLPLTGGRTFDVPLMLNPTPRLREMFDGPSHSRVAALRYQFLRTGELINPDPIRKRMGLE